MQEQSAFQAGFCDALLLIPHTHTHTCTQTMTPPMRNVLERLKVQDYIRIVMFTEKTILEEPVEKWPMCNCLIAFYSKGFPLDKAIEYVKLRKPLVFNDLEMQFSLMDR